MIIRSFRAFVVAFLGFFHHMLCNWFCELGADENGIISEFV